MNSLNKNYYYFFSIILILLTVSFFLRFHDINKQSLWEDEIHSVVTAQQNPTLSHHKKIIGDDIHLPLFFIMLRGHMDILRLFNLRLNAGHIRWMTAFFSTLAVPLFLMMIFSIYKQWIWAILGAMLAGINMYAIFFAQEVRMYAVILCLATLLLWMQLILWDDHGKIRKPVALVLLGTTLGLLYFHLISLFLISGMFLTLMTIALLERKEYPNKWKETLILGLMVGLGFLPLAWDVLVRSSHLDSGHMGQVMTNPREVFKFCTENLLFHSFKAGSWYGWVNKIIRNLFLFSLVNLFDKKTRKQHLLVLLNFFFSFLIYFILTEGKPFQFGRYFSPWWPMTLYLLVAGFSGIYWLLNQFLKTGAKVTILILAGLFLPFYLVVQFQQINKYFNDCGKTNWRGAIQYLNQHHQSKDTLLILNEWQKMAITYYKPIQSLLSISEFNRMAKAHHKPNGRLLCVISSGDESLLQTEGLQYKVIDTEIKNITIILIETKTI